jgi:uncharacterized protein YdaU (DUF1376 family)
MNPPKMPIHIGDLLRDTGHLGPDEFGVYMLLLFHHWSTGSLPDDDKRLATIARMTPSQWKRVRPVLIKFFGEGWRHGRVEYELEKARNISEAAREAGKASGRSRSVKPPLNDRSSSVEPTLLPFKKDAADAAPDPEKDLFARGREVLGKQGGGLVAKLLTAKQKNIALARAAIEQASTKSDPREYIGRIINGQKPGETAWLGGVEGII